MNAILGFTQLMEKDESCTADQQENLQQISKAGWHLLDLINEVLDLARVESGELRLTIDAVMPEEIVAECLSLVSPLLLQRNIRIENRLAAKVPRVQADYMRLKQVLLNLLSNGIKYNREAGSLVIEAKKKSGMLHLSVRDNGNGMSGEQLQHLFEPFTRFGDMDKVQGTGIGLSICKKLIERMNGKIQVESVVGKGSVFTVVLPLSEISRDSKPKSSSLDELSLLYIEGDSVQQSLLERWASDRGWNIEFANDASSGIDAVMKSRYDAILLDIDLPDGFSGLDVKSVFDEMESVRAIPVIGFSSKMEKTDIEAALQAGFAAYLTKPVDLAELERVVQTAVRARSPLN
jgi:CheY-like chemotaxis protein